MSFNINNVLDSSVRAQDNANNHGPLVSDEIWQEDVYTPDPSRFKSLLRGAAQGVTFGLSDEINAGLWSILPGISYRDKLEENREKHRRAMAANPGAYLAGEIGGAVGSAFIPGGLLAQGARLGLGGPRIARVLGKGAQAYKEGLRAPLLSWKGARTASGLGGLHAAGLSEADSIGEFGKDVGIGALAGGVGSAGLGVLGKSITPFKRLPSQVENLRIWQGLKPLPGETKPLKGISTTPYQRYPGLTFARDILSILPLSGNVAGAERSLRGWNREVMKRVLEPVEEIGKVLKGTDKGKTFNSKIRPLLNNISKKYDDINTGIDYDEQVNDLIKIRGIVKDLGIEDEKIVKQSNIFNRRVDTLDEAYNDRHYTAGVGISPHDLGKTYKSYMNEGGNPLQEYYRLGRDVLTDDIIPGREASKAFANVGGLHSIAQIGTGVGGAGAGLAFGGPIAGLAVLGGLANPALRGGTWALDHASRKLAEPGMQNIVNRLPNVRIPYAGYALPHAYQDPYENTYRNRIPQ